MNRREHGSLQSVFNSLERSGFSLVGSGGAQSLVFVFHKAGLAPEPVKEEVVAAAPAKKEKKGKKKEDSDSAEEKPKKKDKKAKK